MNLKKRDLVIGIILIAVFLISSISVSVYASDNKSYLNWITDKNSTNTENTTNTENATEQNNIPQVNNVNAINTVNSNTNTPGELADTGLENAPWLIIGACAVIAIFAYKKVKEYKLED